MFDVFFFLDIKMSDTNFIVPEELYVSILCFLTFNVCAMLGSLATSWVQWVSVLSAFVN